MLSGPSSYHSVARLHSSCRTAHRRHLRARDELLLFMFTNFTALSTWVLPARGETQRSHVLLDDDGDVRQLLLLNEPMR